MSLTITPYLEIDDANDYFDERPDGHKWTCCNSENQEKLLKFSTRLINQLRFKGCKTVATQLNQFPRDISDDLVPDDIKVACCEIAFALLNDVDVEQEIDNLFVTNNTYATVSTGNSSGVVPAHIRAGIPSSVAWNYLRPYLMDPRKIQIRRVN